jgi:hypothetical protein
LLTARLLGSACCTCKVHPGTFHEGPEGK